MIEQNILYSSIYLFLPLFHVMLWIVCLFLFDRNIQKFVFLELPVPTFNKHSTSLCSICTLLVYASEVNNFILFLFKIQLNMSRYNTLFNTVFPF